MSKDISTFNISVIESTWKEIQEYTDIYKKIIKFRDECRPPFMHKTIQDEYRMDTISYMKIVAADKRLMRTTLQLAVYIMDIFMDHHLIVVNKLLLLANTCLLISGKIEENSNVAPKISELNSYVDNQYELNDYKDTELIILKFFDWHVMFPTPAHYTHYFLQHAINSNDVRWTRTPYKQLVNKLSESMIKYLEIIVDDIHYMQYFVPSQLAAAIISAARISIGLTSWTDELKIITDFSDEGIENIRDKLLGNDQLECNSCRTDTVT